MNQKEEGERESADLIQNECIRNILTSRVCLSILLLTSLTGIINERTGTNISVISSGKTFIQFDTLEAKKNFPDMKYRNLPIKGVDHYQYK